MPSVIRDVLFAFGTISTQGSNKCWTWFYRSLVTHVALAVTSRIHNCNCVRVNKRWTTPDDPSDGLQDNKKVIKKKTPNWSDGFSPDSIARSGAHPRKTPHAMPHNSRTNSGVSARGGTFPSGDRNRNSMPTILFPSSASLLKLSLFFYLFWGAFLDSVILLTCKDHFRITRPKCQLPTSGPSLLTRFFQLVFLSFWLFSSFVLDLDIIRVVF